ncbi:hypothetical protein L1987_51683 [Smallanthus sonchifolius]|uniref:Uncharacterized protein n=1 Tax=Smallanthus sonchifolius TaxID=185202 RepID=A0ACB9ERF3_9ASTR|nr:hypothetical protein L1987_51683 [Smallanthus sonchifolius]
MKDLISCFNAGKLPHADESDHRKPKRSSIVDDRKRDREKRVEVGTTAEKRGGGGGGGGREESPASWQSCEREEDGYIVFYFKDDDAGGEVVEERGLESSSAGRRRDAVCCNRRMKEIETGKSQVDENPNESEQHRYTWSESSDSSAGSFAFPTIHREWTGSPVLMPRPEGHNKSCGVCFGSHNTFITSSNQIASLRTVRDLLTRKEKLRCSPSQVQGSGGFS